MHKRLKEQYKNSSNLSGRIELHESYSKNKEGWHHWLFDRMALAPDARILELGCGNGVLWEKNHLFSSPRWKLTFSDLSAGMLANAKERVSELYPEANYEVIDAQDIPFQANTFDNVIANHMLYHVEDPGKSIAEIRRVLKPGGMLYASTNGRNHLKEINELLYEFDPMIELESASYIDAFGLENGKKLLSSEFGFIEEHYYEDGLVVTEAEPLIRYILTTMSNAAERLNGEALMEFRDFLNGKIDHQGAIHISKDSGLFRAM
ncbi:class I SAM-dependent methyltransferase [Pseudalkalibacillus caeni]|uniref:Class I SAM-dependent methyltransferase n=1 Tax=Exobacillus caeni TaxID=2574798 RepID=A0A5R9EZ62_9BACL|nr:class I SAM-dependent methyltransferase [Pseudalkalibacillus caeni]TLS35749.1 class I SAM-dependent methyltransferase [Pseudalkalibacillus caeni]